MRRRLLPVAIVLLSVLSACSSGVDGEADGSDGPFPSVTGEFGERPALTFPDGEPSTEVESTVLHEGEGRALQTGDLLVAHYFGQVWDGAIVDNSYDRGAPSTFSVGEGSALKGWDAGLAGQRVGSRVLMTIPPEQGYGPEGNEAAGVTGTDTLTFVVDLVAAYGPQESGAADAVATAESASVGPQVEGEPGSPPTVSVPADLPEPAELRTTVLARSSGAPVAPGRIVVQYVGMFWDNSEGESTWELGTPRVVPAGSGGAFDELVGVPVGSRVLQELPATDSTPSIALVVDILGQTAVDQ
jgi:peptidylprolyl isomerase